MVRGSMRKCSKCTKTASSFSKFDFNPQSGKAEQNIKSESLNNSEFSIFFVMPNYSVSKLAQKVSFKKKPWKLQDSLNWLNSSNPLKSKSSIHKNFQIHKIQTFVKLTKFTKIAKFTKWKIIKLTKLKSWSNSEKSSN